MKMRMSTIALLLLALALLAGACGNGGETATEATGEGGDAASTEAGGGAADLGLMQDGQIVVGSDMAFAPFEFIEDGEPRGFDIDLMTEIADRLGVEPEFVNASFDTIFTQLAGGEFDTIISAITITDERDETIDFSEPYFQANQALAVPEGSDIAGVDDLAGAQLAVQAGTTGLDYANANFTDATVVEFPTSEAAFAALSAEQVDAVFIDIPVVQERVDSGDAVEIAEEVDTDELYGIGVQEGDAALQEAINAELQAVIDDGTYAEIFNQWFPDAEVPADFQPAG